MTDEQAALLHLMRLVVRSEIQRMSGADSAAADANVSLAVRTMMERFGGRFE